MKRDKDPNLHMELIPGLPDDVGLECLTRVPYEDFSSVISVCRGWKHEIELPEFWRRRKSSGLTRKVIVMAQSRVDPEQNVGLNKPVAAPVYRLTAYEPETGRWVELPPIPDYPDGLPMFCRLVGVGLNLVVVGGWNPVTWEVLNTVYVYNFVSATWRRGTDMLGSPRSFFACASDSKRTVFVAGGHDGEKCALKSALAYDVGSDTWSVLPDMARERDESKGIFLRGTFTVVGGYSTSMQGVFEASAEVFDFATWQWLPIQENFLKNPTCPKNCFDDGNENLYICRESDVASQCGSKWQDVCKMPNGMQNVAYMTAWQGKILAIGIEGFGAPNQVYVYDLKSGKWEKVEAKEEFNGHVQCGCCLEL